MSLGLLQLALGGLDDPPYVAAFENKPPGIFLLHRLAYAIFGQSIWPVKVLGIAAAIGTMFLVCAVGRR